MDQPLALAYGLRFQDLYSSDGLLRVDARSSTHCARRRGARAAARATRRRTAPASARRRCQPVRRGGAADQLARVDAFVGALFGIDDALAALRRRHHELDPLYEVKTKFVRREAAKLRDRARRLDADAALRRSNPGSASRTAKLAFARAVLAWQREEADEAAGPLLRDAARARLGVALRYSAWAATTAAGRRRHAGDVLFALPAKTDPMQLIGHAHSHDEDGVRVFTIEPGHLRRREGFALTDAGTDLRGALDQANYCIWCRAAQGLLLEGHPRKPGPSARPLGSVAFGVNRPAARSRRRSPR